MRKVDGCWDYGVPSAYGSDECLTCRGHDHCYKVFETYMTKGVTPSGKIMDAFTSYV